MLLSLDFSSQVPIYRQIRDQIVVGIASGELRPGEKLFEEKLMAEEGLKKTENELIHIGKPIPFDVETFLRQLEELAKASYENSGRIVELVEEIVPTFHPSGKKLSGTVRKTEMDAKAEAELARKEAAAAGEN